MAWPCEVTFASSALSPCLILLSLSTTCADNLLARSSTALAPTTTLLMTSLKVPIACFVVVVDLGDRVREEGLVRLRLQKLCSSCVCVCVCVRVALFIDSRSRAGSGSFLRRAARLASGLDPSEGAVLGGRLLPNRRVSMGLLTPHPGDLPLQK